MVQFTGDWSSEDTGKQKAIQKGARIWGQTLANVLNTQHPDWYLSAQEAFLLVHQGSVTFQHMGATCETGCGAETQSRNLIHVYKKAITHQTHWAIHELGHAFNQAARGKPRETLEAVQAASSTFPNRTGASTIDSFGFAGDHTHPWMWQHSRDASANEEIADMMVGFAYNRWEVDTRTGLLSPEGQARSDFMATNMPLWVNLAINR